MSQLDCLVVGAGVIGLAIAQRLAAAGHSVIVAEAARAIGTGISARSSEVIHAGLYYPPGSLKARLCRSGAAQLYTWCEARSVPHRRIGKLIVASDAAEADRLDTLNATAAANGATLERWSAARVAGAEPALVTHGALFSPATGIIDSAALIASLAAALADAGGAVALATTVIGATPSPTGVEVRLAGGDRVTARWLVNAAGLGAPAVAADIDGLAAPPLFLAKGHYFALAGRAPVSRLVYPLPPEAGLGIHLTLDTGGGARFGPDVEWVERIDHAADPARAPAFYAAIRRYWPGLPDGALTPAWAGIRPKLVGPGAAAADFLIAGPAAHGLPGIVNLAGIESPGLTACLAIADEVAAMVAG